jgi:hypothetical protein
MTRRIWLALALPGVAMAVSDEPAAVRGKLAAAENGPVLQLADGRTIRLQGDGPTIAVVKDKRLAGSDFEVRGRWVSSSIFRIDPIHKRNIFVHKDGRKLQISYWCGVCSIRTWSPGVCMCCQDETELDLKENFEP